MVRETLAALLRRLNREAMHGHTCVPEDVLCRFEAIQRQEVASCVDDLKKLDRALARGWVLGAGEFKPLDSICHAAEATTSAIFHTLNR